MNRLPKRKSLRLKEYDYSSSGAYFVTICAKDRRNVFWEDVGANCVRPLTELPLSAIGKIVDSEIQGIENIYNGVYIAKYCIMPDHIHLLIHLENIQFQCTANAGEHSSPLQAAEVKMIETHNPTISRIVKQFKGAITKKIGHCVWQKSFVDRIIRNDKGYSAVWEYIHCNPIQPDFAYDNIDFDLF